MKFTSKFVVNDSTFNMEHQQLVFEGIDTYADILLNGQLIAQT